MTYTSYVFANWPAVSSVSNITLRFRRNIYEGKNELSSCSDQNWKSFKIKKVVRDINSSTHESNRLFSVSSHVNLICRLRECFPILNFAKRFICLPLNRILSLLTHIFHHQTSKFYTKNLWIRNISWCSNLIFSKNYLESTLG